MVPCFSWGRGGSSSVIPWDLVPSGSRRAGKFSVSFCRDGTRFAGMGVVLILRICFYWLIMLLWRARGKTDTLARPLVRQMLLAHSLSKPQAHIPAMFLSEGISGVDAA